jgi:hypothetical protein
VTHRPRAWPKGRHSWFSFLAALLGALTSAVASSPSTSFVSASVASERDSTARIVTSKPTAVRVTSADLGLNSGGMDDGGVTHADRQAELILWASQPATVLPAPFVLAVSAARVRDGLTRAPPLV